MLDYMEMLESLILAWKEKDVQLEEGKAEFYSSLYLHVFHSIAHSWHFFYHLWWAYNNTVYLI